MSIEMLDGLLFDIVRVVALIGTVDSDEDGIVLPIDAFVGAILSFVALVNPSISSDDDKEDGASLLPIDMFVVIVFGAVTGDGVLF